MKNGERIMKIMKGTVLGVLAILLVVACQPASLEIPAVSAVSEDSTSAGTLQITIPNVAPWVVTEKDTSDGGEVFTPKAFIYANSVYLEIWDTQGYWESMWLYPNTFGEGNAVWIADWSIPAGTNYSMYVEAYNLQSSDYVTYQNPSTYGYAYGINVESGFTTPVTVTLFPYNWEWLDNGFPLTSTEPLGGERWYYMYAQSSQMDVYLYNETADLDLYVFDQSGALVDLSYAAGTGGTDAVSVVTVPGQYYYIAVYAFQEGQYQVWYEELF